MSPSHIITCATGALLSITTGYAIAHNVVAGAYTEGLLVQGEIGYSDGRMAADGSIVAVFDGAHTKRGESIIKDGQFSYLAKAPMPHILIANLGAGHIAKIEIPEEDFSVFNHPIQTMKATSDNAQTSTTSGVGDVAEGTTPSSVIDPMRDHRALQNVVRSAVAQQVKPLVREIRLLKEKVMLRDIMGGLGMILGLFGIALWVSTYYSRKKAP
jgi:nickel transport protein